MGENELLGAVLTAIMVLATAFWFFYEKFQKRNQSESDYRVKQLEATLQTNHELKTLNYRLENIIKSDDTQNKRLDIHDVKFNSHDIKLSEHSLRIANIEKTTYIKDKAT